MSGLALIAISAVASAVLLLLALPPLGIYFLGWAAFAPLFAAVQGRGFLVGFVSGLGVCVIAAALSTVGILYTERVPGTDASWTYTGFALFGVAAGLTAGLVGEGKTLTGWRPFALAAWAVLFEALLLLKLPAHIALTQYRAGGIVSWAAVTGVWGVSFAVWFLNLKLASALIERRLRAMACFLPWLAPFVVFVLLPEPKPAGITVAAIQTPSGDLDVLAELNKRAGKLGAVIVVWPELSALSTAPRGNTRRLQDLAIILGQPPFVTTFEDDFRPMPHNAAALFTKNGESERYFKRKPFGGESRVHTAGTGAVAVTCAELRAGLNICFDSCFPYVMRETARLPGVDLILLPSLDPESPHGFVQAVHAAYTPFRAAELGLPIVRADTTAHSMIVDNRGHIVAEVGTTTPEILTGRVRTDARNTLYKRWGDWFLYFCGLVVVAGFVLGRRARRDSPA